MPLSLLANPAVHHVRMQALGQSYTAYAGSRLGTAGQYLCLELLAVLTPPWAVLIQKLFHRLHDPPSWERCPLHELPSRWVRQPHTGEESLGHWLCGRYRAPTPMLAVWIEGPGTVVRALLRTNASGACYRCLWHSNRRGELRSVLDPLSVILAGHGCEGLYVPFPASVSVQAASLGTEMTLDWINGVHSPALRTRLIDQAHQLATPDCDPLPDRDCPLCNS